MKRIAPLILFFLATPALAGTPFVTSLPAQRLACITGESPVVSATAESLRALRKELLAARVERAGFPFFLKVTPVVDPPSAAGGQDPAADHEAPLTETKTLDTEGRLTWKACVPLAPEVGQSLHPVETSKSTVVILSLEDLESSCSEELVEHLAQVLGEEERGVPRSIPLLQPIDTSSPEARLEPFLATEVLEVAELTRFSVTATNEPVDLQLRGDVNAPRPLFANAEEKPPERPSQSGVVCLVEVSADQARRLVAAWSVAEGAAVSVNN